MTSLFSSVAPDRTDLDPGLPSNANQLAAPHAALVPRGNPAGGRLGAGERAARALSGEQVPNPAHASQRLERLLTTKHLLALPFTLLCQLLALLAAVGPERDRLSMSIANNSIVSKILTSRSPHTRCTLRWNCRDVYPKQSA